MGYEVSLHCLQVPAIVHILSLTKLIHILIPILLRVRFNINLTFTLRCPQLSLLSCFSSLISTCQLAVA